jgi:DNA transposition AAA+ family ATPase
MRRQHHQASVRERNQHPPLSDTETNSKRPPDIVETLEHRRFAEFCDACRRYGYIGLCYGSPGVGKTLSAKHYSGWDKVQRTDYLGIDTIDGSILNTVFYTPEVVNTPGMIDSDIHLARAGLLELAKQPLLREKTERLDFIRRRDEEHQRRAIVAGDWLDGGSVPELQPTFRQVADEFAAKERKIRDPTSLIVIDEADRLRMASLEQAHAIFDSGQIGLILIGMPGLEKRMARYPQFYSRIGFVHEFRPLGAAEVRQLLQQRWTPAGVHLPEQPLEPEAVAAIIRMTGGNFRLLSRLLTQM